MRQGQKKRIEYCLAPMLLRPPWPLLKHSFAQEEERLAMNAPLKEDSAWMGMGVAIHMQEMLSATSLVRRMRRSTRAWRRTLSDPFRECDVQIHTPCKSKF